LAFPEGAFKSIGKLKSVLAFPEGAGKKVFASLEMCWHSLTEVLKSIGKLRKVLAFALGAV
jgi:hypothetical protein